MAFIIVVFELSLKSKDYFNCCFIEHIQEIMNEANSNTNHQDNTNGIQSSITQRSNLWKFMKKLNNEKAKCNICSKMLIRQNGATSGLRKHLSHIHKIEPFSTSLAHS